jgi:hypothetical protein
MVCRQKKSQGFMPAPKNLQRLEPILRPRPAAETTAPEVPTKLEGPAMNTQPASSFDSTSDVYEIGLMAAASPEFAEKLMRALLAAAEGQVAQREAGDASTKKIAA